MFGGIASGPGHTINNCYTTSVNKGARGGELGNGSYTNCFFLKGIWVASDAKRNQIGETGEEESYMKSDAFVTALNAGRDIWTRDENINDGYPILKSINYR